jgi:hypothetical protein
MQTGPHSRFALNEKLLQGQSFGSATNFRFNGFMCMERSFSTNCASLQTLKSE